MPRKGYGDKMEKLSAESINKLIEDCRTDNQEEGLLIPRTWTYTKDVYVDFDLLFHNMERLENLVRQALPFFAKNQDSDFALRWFQQTGERDSSGKYVFWTRNHDDISRYALLAMYMGILDKPKQTRMKNQRGDEREVLTHRILRKLEPLLVKDCKSDGQEEGLSIPQATTCTKDSNESGSRVHDKERVEKLSAKSINMLIEECRTDDRECSLQIPQTMTYTEDVYINFDLLVDRKERLESLIRQALPFFAKNIDADFPESFFQQTGERDNNGKFKYWTQNEDDLSRYIYLAMYTGIIDSPKRTIMRNSEGEKIEVITHGILRRLKPLIVR